MPVNEYKYMNKSQVSDGALKESRNQTGEMESTVSFNNLSYYFRLSELVISFLHLLILKHVIHSGS